MFRFTPFLTVVMLLAALVMLAQQPRRVDDTLLKTGSKTGEEWISYGVNWAEQRYSPLNQINASNVSRLGLAWAYDIPLAPGNPQTHQEGTPLVFNGVLYSITPWSIVYAVDLKTHKEVWKADPEVNQQIWRSRICSAELKGASRRSRRIFRPARVRVRSRRLQSVGPCGVRGERTSRSRSVEASSSMAAVTVAPYSTCRLADCHSPFRRRFV